MWICHPVCVRLHLRHQLDQVSLKKKKDNLELSEVI